MAENFRTFRCFVMFTFTLQFLCSAKCSNLMVYLAMVSGILVGVTVVEVSNLEFSSAGDYKLQEFILPYTIIPFM